MAKFGLRSRRLLFLGLELKWLEKMCMEVLGFEWLLYP